MNLDKITIWYGPKDGPPAPQSAALKARVGTADEAARVLRDIAENLELGLLVAGYDYEITVCLHGHDDGRPNFVGKAVMT